MNEALHCHICNALLGHYRLGLIPHIELQCPECGEWNVFDYDPDAYVFK